MTVSSGRHNVLNGRRPRTKEWGQFVGELNRIYELGFRGIFSLVDDNLSGIRKS